MHITDEIRNYQITKGLPVEQHKTYNEYVALAMLKYTFPDRFSNLHKAESPDLQDSEGNLGVEVTFGGSSEHELISGVSYKYTHAKTEKERKKYLRIIREHGGDRDWITTSYPVETSYDDKKI